ncbi:LysM peptidoglycan-binding domain-containing protein [Dysgonomonas sp. 216]|uniref:lytic transglycosylase n=1 Tax=Dysgonomonas sp. 216 TaxID=2302934 RepID=UPI00351A3B69
MQEDDDNTDELLENEDADMEVADSISIDVADTTIAESDDIQVTNRILAEDTQTIYHKVRIGETLLLIANRYNVSTKEIQEWNNIDSKKVSIGQRLKIMLPKKELERMVEARKEAEAQKEADLKLEAEIQKEEEEKRLAEEKKIAEERKVAEEKRIAEEKKRTEERRIAEEKEHREALKQAEARRLLDKNKNGTGTPRQKTITYVVKKGDTLSGIAKRYKGVKVNDIMKASNITSDKLSLGQKLTIPIK